MKKIEKQSFLNSSTRLKKDKMRKTKKKSYTSIQLTIPFWKELKEVKDINHFDSFESVIRYLIGSK